MTTSVAARQLLLDEAALETARAWAAAFAGELAREGRRAEGGWPGTIREARARVGERASRVLTADAMKSLSHEELDRLARITYDEARRVWRAM